MRRNDRYLLVSILLISSLLTACNRKAKSDFSDWRMAGGNAAGNKYSSLDQVDTSNVHLLTVAWEYRTGDADSTARSQIQCNPIVVDGILYGTSPQLKLFAIDAATGEERWVYDPFDAADGTTFGLHNNRGVAYWSDGKGTGRIFYAAGPYLHAVDAKTGEAVETFGVNGKKDLHDGLGADFADLFVTNTSPPTIYRNLVISGTRVSEAMDAAPGHIRAYDVHTGEIVWTFRTIPEPGGPGSETWDDQTVLKWTGGGNNWMGMTLDHARGILYAPTGSAAMDFYGGKRKGSNLYTDCLLALDAATGKLRWYFQYIHHNTWDWDPSSAPVLLTVNHGGRYIDAVAQTTKTGFVFLFDRETGASLFPIVETPVDTTTELAGEKLWPTQPIPQRPAPFVRQSFTESDINPYLTKEEYEEVRQRLLSYRAGGMFLPQSQQGTVIFPGFDGGAEWGGPAVDPTTGLLYVNANEMAWVLEMWEAANGDRRTVTYREAGEALFRQNCMACHGADRRGSGNNPSLAGIASRYTPESFTEIVEAGRGMMPAFRHLGTPEKEAIATYVLDLRGGQKPFEEKELSPIEKFRQIPYNGSGYNRFLSKQGNPAIAPPWGTLNAIDMNTGELVWKTVLGDDPALMTRGVAAGTENYGGPAVTKGGLLFIGATKDAKFRAFNKRTGELLWTTALPAAGFATPAVYEVNGKQYVVIACGGGKLGAPSGDSYIAFTLPE